MRPSPRLPLVFLALLPLACRAGAPPATISDVTAPRTPTPALGSIAYLVHRFDAMSEFYSEAFGITFREVDTFGITSRFGEWNGLTIKLVPLRQETEFVEFPDLQLGVWVDSIERVTALAQKYGGRPEGEVREEADGLHAAVRDPDGNTIELYEAR